MSLFAILLFGVNGPPAFSSLAAGFPVFDNPFSQSHRAYTLQVANFTVDPDSGWGLGIRAMTTIDLGETEGPPHPNVPDCSTGLTTRTPRATYPWWNCLSQKDQLGTYYESLGIAADFLTDVGLGTSPGVATDHLVTNFKVNIECVLGGPSEPLSSLSFSFIIPGAGSEFTHSNLVESGCGSTWKNITFDDAGDIQNSGVTTGDFENAILEIQHIPSDIHESASDLRISFISVDIFYSPTRLCGGSAIDQANCYISQALQFLLDILAFVLNLALFVIDWVVFLVTFLGNIVSTLLWFYNIPGTPPIIQGIIDVVVTVFAAILVYTVAKLLRGSGPV
jgi:hypothetical protein